MLPTNIRPPILNQQLLPTNATYYRQLLPATNSTKWILMTKL